MQTGWIRVRVIPDPGTAGEKTLAAKVARVVKLFEREKGVLAWPGRRDPLKGLVETILSHNTNDRNRDMASDALHERYKSWAEVHAAPPDELAEVVRSAGLNRQKARRIQGLLEYLKLTHGEYSADFLDGLDFDQAVEALGRLEGIGLKTLAVVMAFDLGVDVFPVDTHVHRLCRRIGFVPDSFDAVKTFKAMRSRVPRGKGYQFHLHLIRHGREICKARQPNCEACFVGRECRSYGSSIKGDGR